MAVSNGQETKVAAAEQVPSSPTTSSVHKSDLEKEHLEPLDPAEVARAVRKMDLTILPIMTMFYLLSFLVSFLSTF